MRHQIPYRTLLLISLISTIVISKIILDADVVETDKLRLNTFLPDSLVIQDSSIVDQFTMTFNGYYLHSTPVLSSEREYSMLISGTYRIAAVSNGLDAAYYYCYFSCIGGCDFNTPCDSVLPDDRITHSLRPLVDTFDIDHSYYYSFTGADTAMVFEFEDGGGYGDNAGSLSIMLFDTPEDIPFIQVDSASVYFRKIESGVILRSPDGDCWKVSVNNGGVLVTSTIGCPD